MRNTLCRRDGGGSGAPSRAPRIERGRAELHTDWSAERGGVTAIVPVAIGAALRIGIEETPSTGGGVVETGRGEGSSTPAMSLGLFSD